jgi:hypothetical protein
VRDLAARVYASALSKIDAAGACSTCANESPASLGVLVRRASRRRQAGRGSHTSL